MQVQRLDGAALRARAQRLFAAQHYLGGVQAVGEQLHYAVSDAQGEWIAVLIFAVAVVRQLCQRPCSATCPIRAPRFCPAERSRLRRARVGKTTETVELITSRPAAALPPAQWLQANIDHWAIETGLHARLDASRHDDRCRLRRRKARHLHGMFNRRANSLFTHWRSTQPNARHLTTTAFLAHFAEDHDRRALRALTSRASLRE